MTIPAASVNGNGNAKQFQYAQWPRDFTTRFGAQLGPIGIAVFAVLLECADGKDRTCYPSLPTLAARAGVSPRSAFDAIQRIKEAGLVTVGKKRRQGCRPANHYQLTDYRLLDGGHPVIAPGATTGGGLAHDVHQPSCTTCSNTLAPGARERTEEERTEEERPPLPPKGGREIGFEKLWLAYPERRRRGRRKALRLWRELKPDAALQSKILEALRREKSSADWQQNNGRFVPRLDHWLESCPWKTSAAEDPAAAQERLARQQRERDEEARRTAEAADGMDHLKEKLGPRNGRRNRAGGGS